VPLVVFCHSKRLGSEYSLWSGSLTLFLVILLIRTSVLYSSEIGNVAINSDIFLYVCIFKYLARAQNRGETSSFVAVFCRNIRLWVFHQMYTFGTTVDKGELIGF